MHTVVFLPPYNPSHDNNINVEAAPSYKDRGHGGCLVATATTATIRTWQNQFYTKLWQKDKLNTNTHTHSRSKLNVIHTHRCWRTQTHSGKIGIKPLKGKFLYNQSIIISVQLKTHTLNIVHHSRSAFWFKFKRFISSKKRKINWKKATDIQDGTSVCFMTKQCAKRFNYDHENYKYIIQMT